MDDIPAIAAILTALGAVIGAPALVVWRHFSTELRRVNEARVSEARQHATDVKELNMRLEQAHNRYERAAATMTEVAQQATLVASMYGGDEK